MNEVKSWWKSKTIWAGLLTGVVALLTIFGVLPLADYSAPIESLTMLILSAVTVFGRTTATTKIAGITNE